MRRTNDAGANHNRQPRPHGPRHYPPTTSASRIASLGIRECVERLSNPGSDATLLGTGIINNNVQIIRQKIRTLEAVSEGKIPLETFGGSIGLASGCGGFRCA